MTNDTEQTCEYCNSSLVIYKEGNRLVVECSYCGETPTDVDDIVREKFFNE